MKVKVKINKSFGFKGQEMKAGTEVDTDDECLISVAKDSGTDILEVVDTGTPAEPSSPPKPKKSKKKEGDE